MRVPERPELSPGGGGRGARSSQDDFEERTPSSRGLRRRGEVGPRVEQQEVVAAWLWPRIEEGEAGTPRGGAGESGLPRGQVAGEGGSLGLHDEGGKGHLGETGRSKKKPPPVCTGGGESDRRSAPPRCGNNGNDGGDDHGGVEVRAADVFSAKGHFGDERPIGTSGQVLKSERRCLHAGLSNHPVGPPSRICCSPRINYAKMPDRKNDKNWGDSFTLRVVRPMREIQHEFHLG